jgi:hypothetical protein
MEEIRCFSWDSRLFSGRPNAATVAPDAATVTSLCRFIRCSVTAASTEREERRNSPVHCVLCAVSPRLSLFLIRFKFCFLRWFASGEWIFSKHLYHLLAQVFKVRLLPLFCRGGEFLYWSARPHSFSRLLGGVPVYWFLSVTLCFLETSNHP